MKNKVVSRLIHISTVPADPSEYGKWVELHDAVSLLEDNAKQDDLIVYASLPHCFIHTILVPTAAVAEPDVEDLTNWSSSPSDSWGISYSLGADANVHISPPLDHTGSRTLDHGEQLVFMRDFEGRLGDKTYLEILQKFAHVFDLHFLAERNSYCRLDEQGDIEDIVSIFRPAVKSGEFGGTIVTFKRNLLDEYMALTDSSAVRMFDFTRLRSGSFTAWPAERDPEYTSTGSLYYRTLVIPDYASYMRGVQILRSQTSKEELLEQLAYPHQKKRDYASFIANDFKNKVIADISTAPDASANYFTQSELPYEMSPAFFNPEVLQKYKSDSDKYRLEGRSISCRGAWHLETYDVNEAGQVFTYLVYLRRLPYREQLHWKAYNEHPKAPISDRALKSDFEGSWAFDYDALESLKDYTRELAKSGVP